MLGKIYLNKGGGCILNFTQTRSKTIQKNDGVVTCTDTETQKANRSTSSKDVFEFRHGLLFSLVKTARSFSGVSLPFT